MTYHNVILCGMYESSSHARRLERIRDLRRPRRPDLSLAFLKPYFNRYIAKPHKQMKTIIEAWKQLVPENLFEHTRLESLRAGILRVGVDSSAHLYEMNRLLRSGLDQQLMRLAKTTDLRRVQLKLVQPNWSHERRRSTGHDEEDHAG